MVRRNTFQRSRRHRQGDVSCHQYPFKKAILLLGGVIMSVGVLIVQMRTATSIGPSSVPSDLSARRTDITSASNSSSSSSSTRTLLLVTPGPTYKSFSDVPMTEFVVYESDYFYHTSFTEATIVEKQTDPWFTPQKLCQETCCAESVAISLDQDNHHIINTLDGPDLADVLLQQYPNNDAAIRFFGAQMNLAMLPCFQPGTIIHVDNHVMLLEYFFRYWRPRITVPYILITSESDSDSPAVFEDKLSTDPLLIKWFGQSPDASRIPQDGKNKFEGLPLGLSKFHDQDRYLRRYLELTNFANPTATASMCKLLIQSMWMRTFIKYSSSSSTLNTPQRNEKRCTTVSVVGWIRRNTDWTKFLVVPYHCTHIKCTRRPVAISLEWAPKEWGGIASEPMNCSYWVWSQWWQRNEEVFTDSLMVCPSWCSRILTGNGRVLNIYKFSESTLQVLPFKIQIMKQGGIGCSYAIGDERCCTWQDEILK